MRRSILELLTILVILVMALGGCKGEKTAPQQDDANAPQIENKPISKANKPQPEKDLPQSHQDSLEIVSTIPPTPAVLELGEKMRVKIRYNLVSAQKAHIWALPYTNGRNNILSKSHPSYGYDAGNGEMEGWFYFENQTKVDEIRVRMVSTEPKQTIATASLPIDAEWK
ncbi:MAG: hypothetical protein KAY65_09180 [Planctomycetes bacterium]|nr:hypothetical protein [Planctomycetota bacterium]